MRSRRYERMHTRWTATPLDLGRTAFEVTTPLGTRIRLELFDGGGFVASIGVWRIAGWVARIAEAGQA